MSPSVEHPQPQAPPSPEVRDGADAGKLLIIALRCGRLGNRLALFANLIAYAAEHGHRLVNVTFHSYAHLFEVTRRDLYCRYPIARRRSLLDAIPPVGKAIRQTRLLYHPLRYLSLWNEKRPLFGKRVVTLRERPKQMIILLDSPEVRAQIAEARVVFVYGWVFRAPEAMRNHAEVIRAYFRPIAEYERSTTQAVERLRQQADVVLGVHIRHADQRTWFGGKYFFEAARYAQWMHELAAQFPGKRVAFLVCSDEPRRLDEFAGLTVGFAPGSPVEDMYALAKCDYVFGAVSSFTQWASFYGNKPLFQVRDTNDRLELSKFKVTYLDDIPR